MSEKKEKEIEFSEQDDFWDLDMMIPKKTYGKRFAADTEPVEISLGEDKEEDTLSERIPPRSSSEGTEFSYRIAAAREALRKAENRIHLDKETAKELGIEISKQFNKESNAKIGNEPANGGTKNTDYGEIRYDNWFSPSDFDSIQVGVQAVKQDRREEDPYSDSDFEFDLEYERAHQYSGYSKLIAEYRPNSPLILNVRVKSWDYKYMFYERFRASAKEYFKLEGKKCAFQPFFSYLPQYAHLSDRQFSYYLWWRENVREGKYIETSYSYVLLYIFEIINIPELVLPQDGQRQIINVWAAYRKEYPRLDKEVCEWLCDYCLSNGVMPELELLSDFLSEILKFCSFREFYLGLDNSDGPILVNTIFLNCPAYNYRQSKFITDKNRHLFEKHIKGAFFHAFSKLEKDGMLKGGDPSMFEEKILVNKRIRRNAFDSAVCAYDIKREMEIEYLTVSRSAELRFAATDTVKYAENQIRSLLGIKSRFHIPELRAQIRESVDEYFRPYKERAKRKKAARSESRTETRPDYEKDYEAENSEFSAEYSLRLEKEAWAATDMLVSDAENGTETAQTGVQAGIQNGTAVSEAQSEKKNSEKEANREKPAGGADAADEICLTGSIGKADEGGKANLCGAHKIPGEVEKSEEAEETEKEEPDGKETVVRALSYLFCGDSEGFRRLADKENLLPDALADRINETLYDVIGDIVIEDKGNGYEIVQDYKAELEDFING